MLSARRQLASQGLQTLTKMYKAVLYPGLGDTVSCVLSPLRGLRLLCARKLEQATLTKSMLPALILRGYSFYFILQSIKGCLQVQHLKNSPGSERTMFYQLLPKCTRASFSNTVTLGQLYLCSSHARCYLHFHLLFLI